MNYEILDHIRYYKTKEEEKKGQTIITFNAYEGLDGIMVAPKLSRKNSKVKNVTVRINQKDSPFIIAPYRKENQDTFIQNIVNIEGLHAQIGFSVQNEMKPILIKSFLTQLKQYYLLSVGIINQKERGINLLDRFTKEVIQPLFPSFFKEDTVKVYPLVVPARLQQNEKKKEDKFFFYKRYIKRFQRYYQAEQVIYLECPDFGYGLLLFPLNFPKGAEPTLYHEASRYVKDSQRDYPTFFHSNVGLFDMNAYYKYFDFLPIQIEVRLEEGVILN